MTVVKSLGNLIVWRHCTNNLMHLNDGYLFICNATTMLAPPIILLPIEILLKAIFQQYLLSSYCIVVVSETPLNIKLPATFMNILSNDTDILVNLLVDASDKGCSDYIVRIKEPKQFIIALKLVTQLGVMRRSNRKIILTTYSEEYNKEENEKVMNVLSMKETSYVTNALLILRKDPNINNCESYDLITHKYVGADAEVNTPLYLDQWNSCTNQFKNKANLFFYEDLSNMYGKTLKLACFTYKPYVLRDLDTSKVPSGRDGMEIKVMDEFCRWVNCTIELSANDGYLWGEIFENRTGVGILGSLLKDEADVGIAALYSWYEEFVVFDFSASIIRTAVTCIAPAARVLPSWELPLLPFSIYIWLFVVLTFVFASFTLFISQKFSTDKIFLNTFAMIVSQSLNDSRASWRIRSVTGWLLITGLIIDNAYNSGLASTFTVPKYEKSTDTIKDIVDNKLEWGATHDAWVFSLLLSSDPLIKQLVNLFRIYPNEVLEKKSFDRSIAFSVEKLPAGYFAIGDYVTKEAVENLELMVEDLYYEQSVAMLRKSSPYTEKLSKLVGRLQQSGLILAWETQVALKHLDFKVQLKVKLSRSRRDVTKIEALTLRHVVGIFIIYFVGVIISALVFIAENCYYYKISKNRFSL